MYNFEGTETRLDWLTVSASVAIFALLTAVGAFARIPLFPVPVTMQVFFVLLSGLVLGPVYGPASQLTYLSLGLLGAPFFAAPPHFGPTVLLGPTGGYLLGFVVASWVTGWAAGGIKSLRRTFLRFAVASVLGMLAVYLIGATWLLVWLGSDGGGVGRVIALGVRPFILIDTVKALLASASAAFLTGKWRSDSASAISKGGGLFG